MSGGFWAGSVPPWASVILVLVCGLVFVLGLAAGESMGRRHELEDRAEEEGERAARQFRAMRPPADQAMTVLCPQCGAAPMERCDPPMGGLVHKARASLWRAQYAFGPPELHHERRTSTVAFLDPPDEIGHEAYLAHEELASEWHDHPPLKWADEGVPGCPACERRWEVHEGQALALANGSPIDTGEIEAFGPRMDVFLARLLGEHPVPWPDGGDQ